MLEFEVNKQIIKRTDTTEIVADSRNYLTAAFTFSDEWKDKTKTAVFGYNGKYFHTVLEDNGCLVPWEVIRAPYFSLSVFCGSLLNTNMLLVKVGRSGLDGGEIPGTPTPTVWQGYIEELTAKNDEIADGMADEISAKVSKGIKEYADAKAQTAQTNAISKAESLAQAAQAAAVEYANGELAKKADSEDVPAKLSQLTDDVGYAKKSDIASVYRACGTVASLAELSALTPSVGDTYNVTAEIVSDKIDTGRALSGDNIAWNGTAWDNLSGFVDLTPYAKKTETAAEIAEAKQLAIVTAADDAQTRANQVLSTAKSYTDSQIDAVTIPVMSETEYASAVFTSDKIVIVLPDGTIGGE